MKTAHTKGIGRLYGRGTVRAKHLIDLDESVAPVFRGWPKKRRWAMDKLPLAKEWVPLLDA